MKENMNFFHAIQVFCFFLLLPGCCRLDEVEQYRCSSDCTQADLLLSVAKFPEVEGFPDLTVRLYGCETDSWKYVHNIRFVEPDGSEWMALTENDLIYFNPSDGEARFPSAWVGEDILRMEDINFDGFPDLMLLSGSGAQNAIYTCLLYDPEKHEFRIDRDCSETIMGSRIDFFPETKQIHCFWHVSAAEIPDTLYTWKNGKLVLDDRR